MEWEDVGGQREWKGDQRSMSVNSVNTSIYCLSCQLPPHASPTRSETNSEVLNDNMQLQGRVGRVGATNRIPQKQRAASNSSDLNYLTPFPFNSLKQNLFDNDQIVMRGHG